MTEMAKLRGATGEYTCACCKTPFIARTADRARGWARYCSKSCKARKQEARTGQFSALQARKSDNAMSNWDAGDDMYWSGKDYE